MTKPSQLPPELGAVIERLLAICPRRASSERYDDPLPMVGQVWSTHRAGIPARAILEIAPHPTWSEPVVWFDRGVPP